MAKIGPKEQQVAALRAARYEPGRQRPGMTEAKAALAASNAAGAADKESTVKKTKKPKTKTRPKKTKATKKPAQTRKPAAKKPVKTKKPATTEAKTVREGSKLEIVVGLLRRPEGCTTQEALDATGWPAISMPQQARAAGIELRTEKQGRVTRYWAQ